LLLLHLIAHALTRCLVGAPAQQRGAAAKQIADEVIAADLDHEPRLSVRGVSSRRMVDVKPT